MCNKVDVMLVWSFTTPQSEQVPTSKLVAHMDIHRIYDGVEAGLFSFVNDTVALTDAGYSFIGF